MIKKIDIMGIGLDNYTVRESMRQVENYLSNDVLNTIDLYGRCLVACLHRRGPGSAAGSKCGVQENKKYRLSALM